MIPAIWTACRLWNIKFGTMEYERKKYEMNPEKFSVITYRDSIPWARPRWPLLYTHILCVDNSNNNAPYVLGRVGCSIEAAAGIMKPTTLIVLWRGHHVAGDYPSRTERQTALLVSGNAVGISRKFIGHRKGFYLYGMYISRIQAGMEIRIARWG